MKAIIDGKRYNTETAEHLTTWSNRLGYSDFNHVEEELYRTKNGSFFLLGGGGPASKYAEPAPGGGMSGSSNNIVPLTDDEAYDWMERHQETELIEKYFSDQIQDA